MKSITNYTPYLAYSSGILWAVYSRHTFMQDSQNRETKMFLELLHDNCVKQN